MSGKEIDYSITPVSFYKIICNDLNVKDFYVGHTTSFRQRKSKHKQSCHNENSKDYKYRVYEFIRNNGGWENFTMLEIEKKIVKDKREAEWIEQIHKETLHATLNVTNPNPYNTTTSVEYSQHTYSQKMR